jgi:hypothetical protein
MLNLKPISKEAIPEALSKAERYRLLNEPAEAESICQDVLQIEPRHQQALIILLLALSDQFEEGVGVPRAQEVLARIEGQYERAYYTGIICERRAKAVYKHGGTGTGFAAYGLFRDAMNWFEKAEAVRPSGNDDAILRWNTCARFLLRHPHLEPRPDERAEPILLEKPNQPSIARTASSAVTRPRWNSTPAPS